jgi:hypothetical protein
VIQKWFPKGEIKKDPMGVVKMCPGYLGWGGWTIAAIAIGTNSLMSDHLKIFSPQKKTIDSLSLCDNLLKKIG